MLPTGANLVFDAQRQPAIAFPSEWSLNYFKRQHPNIVLAETPFKPSVARTVPA
jgi:hypothetical protein